MPWCPDCKTEYVDGSTHCTNCNTALTAQEPDSLDMVSLILAEKEWAEELLKFLEYSHIKGGYIEYNQEALLYEIFIPGKVEKQATKLTNAFKQSKKEGDSKNSKDNGPGVYINREDKLKDLNSTAYTFLLVGFVGLVVVILGALGVINFYLASNIKYLMYLVMGTLFIIFIIIGFYSMKSAREITEEAKEESELTYDIMDWFKKNFIADDIDEAVPIDLSAEPLEEIKYYKRCEEIKNILEKTYGELEEAYLDKIVDDIYNQLYD